MRTQKDAAPFPFAMWPTNGTLHKRISFGAAETPKTGVHKTSPGELEDVLRSVGLGHLSSQYRDYLDSQSRRGSAYAAHPLVLMSSSVYNKMREHNAAAHRARTQPRGNQAAMSGRSGVGGAPYGYDERGGALGGRAYHDSQGRRFYVITDFQPSTEPHEAGNAQPPTFYHIDKDTSDATGIVPIGSMHSHPPSAFGAQASGADLASIARSHTMAPVQLIMYPYGPKTERVATGFTADVDNGTGQTLRGNPRALETSAYGRTPHTRGFFASPSADGRGRISDMDPRNFIVFDDKKGGYHLTPDNFGRGLHGPSLVPGEHFTVAPETSEEGYREVAPGQKAGSALLSTRVGRAATFGAPASAIVPKVRVDTTPQEIARTRETAKSFRPLERLALRLLKSDGTLLKKAVRKIAAAESLDPKFFTDYVHARWNHIAALLKAKGNEKDPEVRRHRLALNTFSKKLEQALVNPKLHPKAEDILTNIKKSREATEAIWAMPKGTYNNAVATKYRGAQLQARNNIGKALDITAIPENIAHAFPLNRPLAHEIAEVFHPEEHSATLRHWRKQQWQQ